MRLRPPRAAAPDAAPPPTLRRPPRRARRALPTLPDTPAAVDVSDWLASRAGVAGDVKGAHADARQPLATTLAKRRPSASSLVVELARNVTQAAVGGGVARFPPSLADRVAALSPRDASRLLADILSTPPSTGGGVDVALATYAVLDGAGGVDAFVCARMVGEVCKHDAVAWPFDDDDGARSDSASTSSSSSSSLRRRPGPAAAVALYDRWTELRGGCPDVVAVNAALGAAGRAGEWGRAEALFEYARANLEVRGREGKRRGEVF